MQKPSSVDCGQMIRRCPAWVCPAFMSTGWPGLGGERTEGQGSRKGVGRWFDWDDLAGRGPEDHGACLFHCMSVSSSCSMV